MNPIKHLIRNWTSNQHRDWWSKRKIDWKKDYLDTWNHPHRQVIASALGNLNWVSLWEIGCGPGPNLVQVIKRYPNRQVGGSDINPEAIEMARSIFQGGHFEVCPNEDIMGSDGFTDIILADRTLMYTSWLKIDKVIKEMKRSARQGVLIIEYDTESWRDKLKLWLSSGLYAHDYHKILTKNGFYDIVRYKMPILEGADWPQKKMLNLIYAKTI